MSSRRFFLKMLGATSLGCATPFALNLASFNAFAADVTDYKALVCVFLYGGQDGHDVVIPYDQTSYSAWANLRSPLLNLSRNSPLYADYELYRRRENLLLLNTLSSDYQFALTEESRGLAELFTIGRAAVVGNLGPLVEPGTTRNHGLRPPRLFSHNDQQAVWMASRPEGATHGWGGRFGDMILGGNTATSFTAISASGNAVFLSGAQTRQFQIGRTANPGEIGAVQIAPADANVFLSEEFPIHMEAHLTRAGNSETHWFERDMIAAQSFSLATNRELHRVMAMAPALPTQYPDNSLAQQLRAVARIIAQRESLGMRRQIFFVSLGGFDTHANQITALPQLQNNLASAIHEFYFNTAALGVENQVTLFTASDFGRSLQPNGSGTDHGWGNHHMVVGGAVNGGHIFGEIPAPEFNHNQDAGRGRLIPTLAVEQYAAALGSWFGLTDSELNLALPGLVNFDRHALSGLIG